MIRIKRLENWFLFHPTSPNTDKALERQQLGFRLGYPSLDVLWHKLCCFQIWQVSMANSLTEAIFTKSKMKQSSRGAKLKHFCLS